MTKVNKAYPHLLGGVSQEPSEKRGAGEHWLQDNFVSDPVRGLTRRAGAEFLGESAAALATAPDHSGLTRTYDFQVGENYLSLVYDTSSAGHTKYLSVFNRSSGTLVPVSVSGMTDLLAGGITSVTAVGRYVVMAGPGLAPEYATAERYGVQSNLQHHIVWIRGGAYSRTYRLALVRGNQKLWSEYTTPSASYPEPLDTSGLNVNDPDYLKQVNDLTNQYNSAVNAWIARALEAAQPENIAKTLAAEVTGSGFLSPGETCTAVGANIYLLAPSVEDAEVEDGGDGSLARGVGNTVAAAELLSLFHFPGKIVRVRPNNQTDGQCFYMQAIPKDGSTGEVTEVSWRETAGTRFTPVAVFGVLAVDDAGTAAFADTDLAALALQAPEFSGLPNYTPSGAGDIDSNPPQRFLGEPATMLTTFQDRLVVGCNNSVNTSKTSDYFNFFRASIVTVQADDPVNFVAIGGEDDVLRYAMTYDRNLVLWGTGQYLIEGRKPFSPTTVSSVRMASIKDATDAPPTLGDRFMFYGRTRNNGTASIHHLQPGQIQEAPETFELSRRLSTYLAGSPVEIVPGNDPDYLYIRTTGDNALKVFTYQDAANGERVVSAWGRWTFDQIIGNLAGVSVHNNAVFLLFRHFDGGNVRDLLARISPLPGNEPFLDLWVEADAPTEHVFTHSAIQAFGLDGGYAGGDAVSTGTVYTGFPFVSVVTPTSPFVTDGTGLPILNGRTTVNSVKVWTENSSGIQWEVTSNGQCHGQGAWLVPAGEVVCPAATSGTVSLSHVGITGGSGQPWPDLAVGTATNIAVEPGTGDITDSVEGLVGLPGVGVVFNEFWFADAPVTLPTEVTCAIQGTVDYDGVGGEFTGHVRAGEYGGSTPVGYADIDFNTQTAGSAFLRLYDNGVEVDSVDLGPVANGNSPFTLSFARNGASISATATLDSASGSVSGSITSLPAHLTSGFILQFNTSDVLGEIVQPRVLSVVASAVTGSAPPPAPTGPLWRRTSGVAAAERLNSREGVNTAGPTFVNGQYQQYLETPSAEWGDILALPAYPHASASVPIGKETREYRLTLQSYLWAPLTIKSVEWQGQLLYRSRRL